SRRSATLVGAMEVRTLNVSHIWTHPGLQGQLRVTAVELIPVALVGFQGRGFADRVQPDFCHDLLAALLFQSIPTSSRTMYLIRKFAFILTAACPQSPCKVGIHPHLYRCGPLPYFDSLKKGLCFTMPSPKMR